MKKIIILFFVIFSQALLPNKSDARDVTFCQNKESRSNLYISNSTECWNNKYRIIGENEYVIAFLSRFGGSTTSAYQNALNLLYADYRRNNLKINRIHKIIKSTGQLKAYLQIIDKSKKTQVAKKETNATYKCGSKDWLGNTVCGEDWNKNQKTKKVTKEIKETKENNKITKWITKKVKKKESNKQIKKIEIDASSNDKDPPKILISNTIKVNSPSYEIEGKVLDKSKKLFVILDGETIEVKKGKFKIKRFSPINESLDLVAIDQWGNKSKTTTVNIIVDSMKQDVANKVEPLKPNLVSKKIDNNKIAIVIGIEKYKQAPIANFANLDAKYFYQYAKNIFGVPNNNINLLVDDNADLVGTIKAINKWLPGKIESNKTELIIFFAGHGLASNDGKELYLLPQDSDPDLLSRTAFSRTELFETILKLNPKNVTIFFDTCFSGISRDEKTLLASARPIRIVADNQGTIPNNFTIFSASQLDQISSGIEEAKHGIFSYYLMKGLEGNADLDNNRKITNGELLTYMDENVSQKALELGRQQNPSLTGDPDKVLVKF